MTARWGKSFLWFYLCLLSGVLCGGRLLAQDYLAKKYLQLHLEHEGDTVLLYYTNKAPFAFSIKFSSFTVKNLDVSSGRNKTILAPPTGQQRVLLKFPVLLKNTPTSIRYLFTPEYGYITPPNHQPDQKFVYSLPYPQGMRVLVGQGYLGKFSHQNLYALDFNLPEHSRVLAARGGEVVEVQDEFTAGGVSMDLVEKANMVSILHDDGSLATYSHLQFHGARVQLGQMVETGTLLGYSGHTGMASGPHLHFCVYLPSAKGLISVPTLFNFVESRSPGLLQEHLSYTAP